MADYCGDKNVYCKWFSSDVIIVCGKLSNREKRHLERLLKQEMEREGKTYKIEYSEKI